MSKLKWLKINCDRGQRSLKLMMQLLFEDDPVFDFSISDEEYDKLPDKMSGVRGTKFKSDFHVLYNYDDLVK